MRYEGSMGSLTQFVFGTAVGVALFIGASRTRHLFFVSERPEPSPSPAERRNSPEGTEQLHSLQSAVTPVHHVSHSFDPDPGCEAVVGEDVDCNLGKNGQHLLNLLFNVAEDQARKEGYIHRGITCNSCQASPICGVRYKCANCVDYDVCARCEPRDDHNKTHVFLKIKIPMPPLMNPRAPCVKPLYPGKMIFFFIL